MRILVTGAAGQLGGELRRAAWGGDLQGHDTRGGDTRGGDTRGGDTRVLAFDSAGLDITDRARVDEVVAGARPDVIVNAAAWTAVDRAETEEERALVVNAGGVANLAAAADRVGAMLVHVSTDYVFDGTAPGWYTEDDPTGPVSAYGRTKLAGEHAALAAANPVVLRTAWVYGALGPNFVATVLRLAAERDELTIVADQVGCPTATADLAAAIVDLVRWTDGGRRATPSRLYHLATPEPATWHELALAVLDASAVPFTGTCRPITTAEYPTPARRPANSRLDSTRIATELGIELPPWRRSLPAVVAELEGEIERGRRRLDGRERDEERDVAST